MRKQDIPLYLMLVAGAATCIITYVRNYSVVSKLTALLVVLLIFWLLGSVLKWTLEYFEQQNAKRLKEEGEVIEKEAENAEDEKKEES